MGHTQGDRIHRGSRRAYRAAVATLAVLVLTACGGGGGGGGPRPVPTPAPTPAPSLSATCVQTTIGLGTHSLEDHVLDALWSTGVRHTRLTYYPTLHTTPGYAQNFRERTKVAVDRGIQMLVVVHPALDEWGPEQFGRFLADRVREMPHVFAWQIGNEGWTAPGNLSAKEYSRWFTIARDSIHAANPDAIVVTLALHDKDFAEDFSAATDGYSVHVYGYPLASRARELRSWLPRNAFAWITEVGIEQKVIGDRPDWEQEQAREWRNVLFEACRSGYRYVFFYQLYTDEPSETHGIWRPDRTWRPAFQVLREALGATP